MLYLIKKIGYILLTLWLVVTITFILMKAVPGDPFINEKGLPKEILEALREHYGFNDPLYEQYFRYIKSIIIWDLGPSFKYKGQSVNGIINDGFPISAVLGLEALLLSCTFGIILGTYAAVKQNRWQDYTAMFFAVVGISVPSFILATLLQYVFALKLSIFPVARWGSLMQSVLPAISLAALPTAVIARLIRANMLEVLQQEYIKTALAKGVAFRMVVIRHAVRNALLPVMSYLGQLVTNILVGSFVIERIFGIPGLGQWFVTSVSNRDYTVIMGLTVFYSILLLTTTLLVDIAYGFLDPRMKK
jgi:oligopeptide transport system permease protein